VRHKNLKGCIRGYAGKTKDKEPIHSFASWSCWQEALWPLGPLTTGTGHKLWTPASGLSLSQTACCAPALSFSILFPVNLALAVHLGHLGKASVTCFKSCTSLDSPMGQKLRFTLLAPPFLFFSFWGVLGFKFGACEAVYHLNPTSSLFCSGYFGFRVLLFVQLTWTVILLF
jgi:hypothetical protein